MGKDRKAEYTPKLPEVGMIPRPMREKMSRQSLRKREREGAAKKRILVKGPTFDSLKMTPEPLNARKEAVNFELAASGHILEGGTLRHKPIDSTDPVVSRLAKEPYISTDPDYDPARVDPCQMYRSILEDASDSEGVSPEIVDIFIGEQDGARQTIPPEMSPRGLRYRDNA